MNLRDKVVIVTGGASGIGLALCERFVQEGARVVLSDLKADAASEQARRIGATAIAANVAREEDVRRLVEEATRQFGRVDVFVSNAGIAVGHSEQSSDKEWDLIWHVNTMSHVYAARAVLPQMLERQEGYLLNVASAAGLLTELHSAPYAVTKHAAVAFAEWLAVTYGDKGIRVSCLCPEFVQTPMIQNEGDDWEFIKANAIPVSTVVDKVMTALAEERFLILTHDSTLPAFQARAMNHEKWLSRMRGYRARMFGEEA
ncbi:SDR family oxidoreductase [Deinococcus yavapaiensis]|uniref:NADP-dependent 3-hydroxy acid dehydrogenase YdfG n=1 Tax=Deinococcus yavapaiensis KR-236 TaxID=694435 RepID=A0A318SAD1_9DEIO|nr:SDR family oxidoreductase [Deinococcus yavapaiensis]PYE54130.1 NADP-dependent 3-hydroxy acid dehydrogenase YdfG [Deinococcus yavapaiensis KR-236]